MALFTVGVVLEGAIIVALVAALVLMALLAVITAPLILEALLGLLGSLLLGPLVQGGGEFPQGVYKMHSQIALGFVGLLNGFGNRLDRPVKVLQREMDRLQAAGDVFEEFGVLIRFGRAHFL